MINIQGQIEECIGRMPDNAVFFISDFSDIGKYDSVKKAVQRLEQKGTILRVIDGLYTTPKYSRLSGELIHPSINDIAQALARKFGWTIIPTGDTCLNMLGLSTQMPAHYEYLSDGPYRKYCIYGLEVSFKHTTNKEITHLSYKSSLIVQALKALGKNSIGSYNIQKIRSILNEEEKNRMLDECKTVTSWVYEKIKEIGEGIKYKKIS